MIRSILLFRLTDSIWLEDIPNVERIYNIVMDIYLVREMHCFVIEEDLFAKLIFLMRSHELVIKCTRFFDDPYNPDIIFDRRRRSVGYGISR